MDETPKSRKRLFIIGLVVLLLLLGWLWQQGLIGGTRYIAVYLRTGDLYFGERVGLWGFKLDKVWLFQRQADGNLGLVPFRTAAWNPAAPLRINRDQIVFWTYLDPEGQVAQAIAGRLPLVQQPLPVPSATGTAP